MADTETIFRPLGATGLPTSVTAMRYAVELAANTLGSALDLDRARTWVLIAAELRAGEFQSVACPRPAAHMATEYPRDGDLRRLDTGQLQEYGGDIWHDVEEPPYAAPDETVSFRVPAPDETQVIHGSADGAECGNCGHAISLYLPGPDNAMQEPTWIHNLTAQSVCPVSAPDKPHTFAIPRGDGRG